MAKLMAQILTVTKNQSRIYQLNQHLDYIGLTGLVSSLLDINNVVMRFAKTFATHFPINVLALLIAKRLPPRPRHFLEQGIGKFVWRGFMHMFGVMGIVFGIAFFWEWYSPTTRSLKPIVRVVAYFADFQQVALYPGVDTNRRLRLHENGVVSYAEECGWDICISVDEVQ